MSSYRFCRTDDVALLVEALTRCWSPYFPDEPAVTPASFKRSIRDLQVWCSSCMVAFSGGSPIGVLIGAKRPWGTLVHTIAVHPDHRRQGHARHLLTSLSSKLAILGPPRMVAEVPGTFVPASGLFDTSGYAREAVLTDYVLQRDEAGAAEPPGGRPRWPAGLENGQFVIPVTVGDLAANGLLGEDFPQVCWQRSVETLMARKDDIAGLAVASDERIEACVLYEQRETTAGGSGETGPGAQTTEIVSLRTFVEDGGARLQQLLAGLRAQGIETCSFPKVHPAEISAEMLETLGFRPAASHVLYAARARAS